VARLTKTSDKGGLAFTFDLDITCDRSEIEKIVKLGEALKAYEDAEEQGLLIKLPPKTDKGNVTYIYSGSVWVVKLENVGHVISKRKVTKFYPNYEAAEEALEGVKTDE
jgi:hypothetical protein